jgi:hypothetical protein
LQSAFAGRWAVNSYVFHPIRRIVPVGEHGAARVANECLPRTFLLQYVSGMLLIVVLKRRINTIKFINGLRHRMFFAANEKLILLRICIYLFLRSR